MSTLQDACCGDVTIGGTKPLLSQLVRRSHFYVFNSSTCHILLLFRTHGSTELQVLGMSPCDAAVLKMTTVDV